MREIAVVAFVKSPEFSPVKTRLARDLGPRSLEIYELCLQILDQLFAQLSQSSFALFTPFWAVAETEGLAAERWREWQRLDQGSGDLGTRLHKIYSQLIEEFDSVLFLGADCPQLSLKHIYQACFPKLMTVTPGLEGTGAFQIGPAKDGGYYLFHGGVPIPKQIWESVRYSTADTLSDFIDGISPLGGIQMLPMETDLDRSSDLSEISKALLKLQSSDSLGVSQNLLLHYLRLNCSEFLKES